MLSTSELQDGLRHADPSARDHALRSLSLAGSRCGVPADAALAAIDSLGADAFANPLQLRELPESEQTVRRLFAAYGRSPHPHIAGWIASLPQSLLVGAQTDIQELPSGSLRTGLETRLELGRQQPQDLWNMLAGEDPGPAILALVSQEQFVVPHVLSVLNRKGDPLESLAIELAGRLHLGTALNQVLDRFEDPQLSMAASIAVARIGTAGAVTEIEHRSTRQPAAFRLTAARCLARFRIPSAEETLHRLLLEEDDSAIRCELSIALVGICTTISFDRVCELVRSGDCLDPAIKPQLAGLSILLRRPLPELSLWRGRRETPDVAFAQALRQAPAAPADQSIPAVHLDVPADQSPQPRPAAPTPIRRNDVKVGRNDPCPCGSGRKYKKCCGAG